MGMGVGVDTKKPLGISGFGKFTHGAGDEIRSHRSYTVIQSLVEPGFDLRQFLRLIGLR